MEGPRLLHRFGGHGGRATEWEITIYSDQNPEVAKAIRDLPTNFKKITHSGMDKTGYRPAHESLILPVGVSCMDAGLVVAYLSALQINNLRRVLDLIDDD